MAAEASTSEPSEDPFIGSLVSLTSKDGIRYEGIIYYLNPEGPNIGLQNVRSFGTEGRKKDGLQVPPSNKVFDFLVFQGSEIKDVLVKFLPPVIGAPIRDDPAIVESHYSPTGPASTAGSGTISDQSSQAVQPAHPRSTFQEGLPLYQAGKNIESWGSTLPVANCSELGIPMNLEEFYEPSGLSHLLQTPLLPAPPGLSIPYSLPQRAQFSSTNSLFHEAAHPLPPLVNSTSTSVSTSMQPPTINSLFETATTPSFPKFIPPLAPPVSCTPSLISTSSSATVTPTQASLLDVKRLLGLPPNISPVNTHPDSVFGTNIPIVPPLGYSNAPGASEPENNTFFSSIQGDTLLPSVTPGPLQHPSYSMLPSSLPVQAIHEDAKFKAQEPQFEPLTYELPQPATSIEELLLPLPMLAPTRPNEVASYACYCASSQSHGRGRGDAFSEPVTSFSEDFDFMAMNEKFNKAEVWGNLDKVKALVVPDDRGQPSNENAIREEEKSLNLEIQPAYSKDDFFDSLFSYTSKPRKPSGGARVSVQLKVNLEFSEPVTSFSEDFDFMAMNEKFNKAEVWGHLGKVKALVVSDDRGQPSNVNAIREEEKSLNLEIQPAYSKDDFFDSLFPYKSKPRTPPSGRARVPVQLKVNLETLEDYPRPRSNGGGGRQFRGGNGGHWYGSNYDRGRGSSTRGRGSRLWFPN